MNETLYCLQRVGEFVCAYDLVDRQMIESTGFDYRLLFVSNKILEKRGWSLFPLWGVDLNYLIDSNNNVLDLVEIIKDDLAANNISFIWYAIFNKTAPLWHPDFQTLSISSKKLDFLENPDALSYIQGGGVETLGPYGGYSLIWPPNEEYLVFSDGDNFSFIAGNEKKIQKLLDKKFSYCLEQFVEFNRNSHTTEELYESLSSFCKANLRRCDG